MKRLSNEELKAIRERAEKATEGKWYYEIDGDLYSEKTRERDVYPYLTAESIPYINVSKEDAAFIVHAREDIPKLLAEIERLRSEVANGLLAERIESDVKIAVHGREYDLDEIWRPVRRVIERFSMEYDEAVTLGGQIGMLTSEIERLRSGMKKIDEDISARLAYKTPIDGLDVSNCINEILYGSEGE